jgi:hypothetical protein
MRVAAWPSKPRREFAAKKRYDQKQQNSQSREASGRERFLFSRIHVQQLKKQLKKKNASVDYEQGGAEGVALPGGLAAFWLGSIRAGWVAE